MSCGSHSKTRHHASAATAIPSPAHRMSTASRRKAVSIQMHSAQLASAPSRFSIITGCHAIDGAHHMRTTHNNRSTPELPTPYCTPVPHTVRCFTEYFQGWLLLRQQLKDRLPIHSPESAWDDCSNQAHWRNRESKDQPFFAVFNRPAPTKAVSGQRTTPAALAPIRMMSRCHPLCPTPSAPAKPSLVSTITSARTTNSLAGFCENLKKTANSTTPSSLFGRTTAKACLAPSAGSMIPASMSHSSSAGLATSKPVPAAISWSA